MQIISILKQFLSFHAIIYYSHPRNYINLHQKQNKQKVNTRNFSPVYLNYILQKPAKIARIKVAFYFNHFQEELGVIENYMYFCVFT